MSFEVRAPQRIASRTSAGQGHGSLSHVEPRAVDRFELCTFGVGTARVRVLGVDLAWATAKHTALQNETGVVAVELDGSVVSAGWTRGIDETVAWMVANATDETLAMIDAPLVVTNDEGQRPCETHVGQCYGRWQVFANSTNRCSTNLGGSQLREQLEDLGWKYDSGLTGPPAGGLIVSECYPFTALVGAAEFGYEEERPRYKRFDSSLEASLRRRRRADVCDDLVRRIGHLSEANPRIDLRSHAVTRALLSEQSPIHDRDYKHREDLIDAIVCAWTGLLWLEFGVVRCQVLGDPNADQPAATIIAPARAEQRIQYRPARRRDSVMLPLAKRSPASSMSPATGRPSVARPCRCDCGGFVATRGHFLPGHDGRLRGQVVRGEKPIDVLIDFPGLFARAQFEINRREGLVAGI